MIHATFGVFKDRSMADQALADLEEIGYAAKDISIVVKDGNHLHSTKGDAVADNTISGATTGGVLGGIAGLLVGVGAITLPGFGAILIGGPLVVALGLTGAAATTVSGAVTGALAGGVIGALTGLGLPRETAVVYERALNEGAILLAIPNDRGNPSQVAQVLERDGADQITTV